MCTKTTCPQCHKATWSGCGQHIEEALAGVPQSERCTCAETTSTEKKKGLFARLRGH